MEVKMVCVLLAGVCTNGYCTGFACLRGEACFAHMQTGLCNVMWH